MRSLFQQFVFSWYGIDIPDHEAANLFKPLSTIPALIDEEPWDFSQWVYFMQSQPATESMRLAVSELCWRIAVQWQNIDAEYVLPWLTLWENLSHTRAEYSKRSGCEEYALVTRFDFMPMHSPVEIDVWKKWLATLARNYVAHNKRFDAFVPFMAHYAWLDAIANTCPCAGECIEAALVFTFNDSQPSSFYAQQQWVVWCLRHREPSSTYAVTDVLHRLFSTHSLVQLALFWNSAPEHIDGLLPRDIPHIWQRPVFSGSDITDAVDPHWYQAWVDVIDSKNWPQCLSFWVTLARIKRTNLNPPWLARVIQTHSVEWRFFETTHSWMSQMPQYVEPRLTSENMNTFTADCLHYEYVTAKALWTMYNSKETIDILPLPHMDT